MDFDTCERCGEGCDPGAALCLTCMAEDDEEDLSDCPYYARYCSAAGHDPQAECSYGCTDEPSCVTCRPSDGWPSERAGQAENGGKDDG